MDALAIVSLIGMAVTGTAMIAIRLQRRGLGGGRVDLTPLRWLKVPFNEVGFRARRRLRLSRGAVTLVNEPKRGLFDHLSGEAREAAWAREAELRTRYALGECFECSTQDDYREVLYHLDVLEALGASAALPTLTPRAAAAGGEEEPRLRAIDVGSKDFRYALALERWIARAAGAPLELAGVELDGEVIYRDLHTRRERAEAHCRAVGEHVRYLVQDFLTLESEPVDVLTVFFPFVLAHTLIAWGLPLAHFAPERFFARYRDLLRPGGWLVIANHTHEESAETERLLAGASGFRKIASVPMRSPLAAYDADVPERTLHAWVREG
jgi:SAM-dependent methyltransferase